MGKIEQVFNSSGFSKQDFIVLIRINQSISDLVKRCSNLNGTLQFRIGSLNKQLRQWSFVLVIFPILQLVFAGTCTFVDISIIFVPSLDDNETKWLPDDTFSIIPINSHL